jgi:hypothetical protein
MAKLARIGNPWTKEEETSILADIEAGLHIGDIAVKQQRTTGGIRARLTRLACSFVEDKTMSLYEASGRTGIRAARIQLVLKRKTEEAKAKVVCPTKMEFKFEKTFSRQKLQGHAEETRKAEEAATEARMRDTVKQVVTNAIAPQVLDAARTKATFYLWEGSPQRYGVASDDLLRGLREKFPECNVTVAEDWVEQPSRPGHPPTRVLKSGIKIDWS